MALRYRVKSVDRLLGNGGIHRSRGLLYQVVARLWLAKWSRLVIVVDWSPLTKDQQWQLLRASVALEGRSITVYEEVHPLNLYANSKVHAQFVLRLAEFLPRGCQPIVITDSGFRTPWCQQIAQQGWHWIVRVRHRDMLCDASSIWNCVTHFHAKATDKARDCGIVNWVKRNPLLCRLITIKQSKKGRQHKTLTGKRRRSSYSLKQAQREREPWVLVCDLGLHTLDAQAIVALYAKRMQIEQGFRDTKNATLGMGLSMSRSRSRVRLEMLLLLTHLALFVLHLLGYWARQQQLEPYFQSTNSRKREISIITLAKRMLQDGHLPPTIPWRAIFKQLRQHALFNARNLS